MVEEGKRAVKLLTWQLLTVCFDVQASVRRFRLKKVESLSHQKCCTFSFTVFKELSIPNSANILLQKNKHFSTLSLFVLNKWSCRIRYLI